MNRSVALLAVVVLASTAACDASHGTSTGRGSSTATPTPSSTSSNPLPETPAPVTVRRIAKFALPSSNIGPLSLDGDKVVFPLAEGGGPDWRSVGVLDLKAKSRAIVAHSEFDQGLINWAANTGDWVAWVDQSRRQSDSDPNVLWRIHARNLTTGAHRTLATNGRNADPLVPRVHEGDGHFFWTEPEPDRTAKELIWNPAWARPRAVLRHTEMTPGSETATDDLLVFLGKAATGAKTHTVGGDCWSVPLDGSAEPQPLTHTALAMGCAVSDAGDVVWSEHIDPRQKPLPADGVLDDPYIMRTTKLTDAGSGSSIRLLHRGYLPSGYPVAGDGFAAWRSSDVRLVIRATAVNGQAELARGADALTVTASDGARLAYVQRSGNRAAIVVSEVVLHD